MGEAQYNLWGGGGSELGATGTCCIPDLLPSLSHPAHRNGSPGSSTDPRGCGQSHWLRAEEDVQRADCAQRDTKAVLLQAPRQSSRMPELEGAGDGEVSRRAEGTLKLGPGGPEAQPGNLKKLHLFLCQVGVMTGQTLSSRRLCRDHGNARTHATCTWAHFPDGEIGAQIHCFQPRHWPWASPCA